MQHTDEVCSGESPPDEHVGPKQARSQRPRSALEDLRELILPLDPLLPATPVTAAKAEQHTGKKRTRDGSDPLATSPVFCPPASSTHANNNPTPQKARPYTVRYHTKHLKAIGAVCGNMLPPPSSVQAMFMYEMQRQTEKLDRGDMFGLVRAEQESKEQLTRISELEARMKSFQELLHSKNVDERLHPSGVWMDAQQALFDEQSTGINDQVQQSNSARQRVDQVGTAAHIHPASQLTDAVKLDLAASDVKNSRHLLEAHNTLSEHFSPLEASHAIMNNDLTELAHDFNNLTATSKVLSEQLSELQTTTASQRTTIEALNDDVSLLFDERDTLVSHPTMAGTRIDKLEGLVRAFTAQAPSPPIITTTASTGRPQRLPVRAVGGEVLDLAVPKGQPLIRYRKAHHAGKESLRPAIRPFEPGEMWAPSERRG